MGDDTDAIIREALEEEQKEKRKRKREKKQTAIHTGEESDEDDDDDGEQDRGKNVRGIEEEDEGPIRESMVAVAQTSRAATRKGKGIGDAGLVGNIEEAEEREQRNREQLEKEHGIELEAFNLVVRGCLLCSGNGHSLLWMVLVQHDGAHDVAVLLVSIWIHGHMYTRKSIRTSS